VAIATLKMDFCIIIRANESEVEACE